MKVNLSAVEMFKVLHYASVVYETKRLSELAGDLSNKKYSKDLEPFNAILVGYMGEAAVCQLLGVDFHVEINKYGDDGSDLRYCGFKLQIKTISKDYGDRNVLYCDCIDEVESDILVGAAIAGPASVNVYGAITRDKFIRLMYTQDFGYGDRDCVHQSELSPIAKMLEFFKSTTEMGVTND
jgi:hypothetical protein